MCISVTLASLQSCGIWLVWIDLLQMIDNGRTKSRQLRRTFTFSTSEPLALSDLRWLNLFLTSVGKIFRLYSGKSTLVSIVGLAHL